MQKRNAYSATKFALVAATLAFTSGFATPAKAIEFEYGEFKGSVINTVSAGIQMRTASRDSRFLGPANGGAFVDEVSAVILPTSTGHSGMTHNADDANKHFGQGDIVGAPVKLTTELNVAWRNLGIYGRGTAFYDYIYDNNDLAKFGDTTSPTYGRISTAAQRKAAMGAEVQDLFARGEFDIGTQPLNVRVGQQTLNWGEALFTQNAISIINPLDLQKFAVPGAELRDGLIPVPMAWLSYEIVEGLAIEGFYQWEFKKLRLSPTGTYFGGADVIEESNDTIGGVGFFGDCGSAGSAFQAGPSGLPGTLCFRQRANKDPGDSGNYGVKLNWYAEALNNTEFGLYFVRYTNRFPTLNYGVDAGTIAGFGAIGQSLEAANFYSQTSYERGIKMVALSYNTTLDGPGIAINGEFSYKMDEPGNIYGTTPAVAAFCFYDARACVNQVTRYFDLDTTSTGQEINIPGAIPLDVARANARLTKIFFAGNPVVAGMGAESVTLISETSISYITNLPDSGTLNMSPQITGIGTDVPYGRNGPGLKTATKISSYENLLVLISYPGAFGSPINLTPGLYYGMTIQGNSPMAAGPQTGFKSTNLSLKAEYQQNLTATLNFAKQWGGGFRNTAADKDFVGLTVNYTF